MCSIFANHVTLIRLRLPYKSARAPCALLRHDILARARESQAVRPNHPPSPVCLAAFSVPYPAAFRDYMLLALATR